MFNLVAEGDYMRVYKSAETQFVYTRRQKFIRLIQHDLMAQNSKNSLVKSFILDPKFSIIESKEKEILDYESQLDKEEQSEESSKPLRAIINQKVSIYKNYMRFNDSYDFWIGRIGWGRSFNSLKINNDMISRCHCKLQYVQPKKKQNISENQILFEKDIIKQSNFSSKLRKLPKQILEKIFSYIHLRDRYIITDEGSRNGTFIKNKKLQDIKLIESFGYQFDNQDNFLIFVQQSSNKKPQESISLHNQKILKIIQRYEANRPFNSYQKCKIIMRVDEQALKRNVQKIDLIVLKLDFAEHNKIFYIFGVSQMNQEHYSIGQGQQIDINQNEHQRMLGYICGRLKHEKQQWFLEPISIKYIIWEKIPPRIEYELSHKNTYQIRLGHKHRFELDFYNFD